MNLRHTLYVHDVLISMLFDVREIYMYLRCDLKKLQLKMHVILIMNSCTLILY